VNAYRAPGVYFEWLDERMRQIEPKRTDIAGFVGIAARGPLHKAVRVDSWPRFTSLFGAHIPQSYLAYAVAGFFANGGRRCYVVRVADESRARAAALNVLDGTHWPLFRLEARTPGAWAHELVVSSARLGALRFSLSLSLPDGTREKWANLSLDPGDRRYVATVLNEDAAGSRLVMVRPPDDFGIPGRSALVLGGRPARLHGGADGLAKLLPEHLSGAGAPPDKPWGLAQLELIDEVGIVAIPDIMPAPKRPPQCHKPRPPNCEQLDAPLEAEPAPPDPIELPPRHNRATILRLQQALVAHCERLKDRVALLDTLPEDTTPARVLEWRSQFDTSYAALYYPWVRAPDPLGQAGALCDVPPSGHIAGVYARSDRLFGVHKAPANEAIEDAQDVTTALEDSAHADLNDAGVNVIRGYAARGVRVVGARTLVESSRAVEWRYVNVRRLLAMIEEAIDEQCQWTTFEPNNPDLWREIDRTARGFLDGLWRAGALDGATAEEAYSVRCDATTNPPERTDAGEVTCLIGVRPPWPAEFVLVRIGRTERGAEIEELMGVRDDGNRSA
jgi:phage tail sheath protein FI